MKTKVTPFIKEFAATNGVEPDDVLESPDFSALLCEFRQSLTGVEIESSGEAIREFIRENFEQSTLSV